MSLYAAWSFIIYSTSDVVYSWSSSFSCIGTAFLYPRVSASDYATLAMRLASFETFSNGHLAIPKVKKDVKINKVTKTRLCIES